MQVMQPGYLIGVPCHITLHFFGPLLKWKTRLNESNIDLLSLRCGYLFILSVSVCFFAWPLLLPSGAAKQTLVIFNYQHRIYGIGIGVEQMFCCINLYINETVFDGVSGNTMQHAAESPSPLLMQFENFQKPLSPLWGGGQLPHQKTVLRCWQCLTLVLCH